jgi:catechol 2,3-dioxygenase-like lactoylglutathione lyase family enzyme
MDSNLNAARVSVISIPVSDPAAAKDFYVGRLGFELMRDDDSIPGVHWVQVRPKVGDVSLTLVNWFESMPAGSLSGLVLAVDDLDATCAGLEAAGVEFESPAQDRPWAREAVIKDPDGNQFVLQQDRPQPDTA